ncbi:protein FAM124B isoform X1 [Python bivittatus]|uniref:Protein FAM124B isoform X1 n=2 Tax=Python bivittatus TaxID=176946 RepID=A0A9F5MXV1_PYTBI|nr:protein FAM124B isoform X1 [Python bivittatus]
MPRDAFAVEAAWSRGPALPGGRGAAGEGHCAMDVRGDSMRMTVHLLANTGHALHLQQVLDQLQEWICLDVRLFLVSERPSPIKYYETYRQKSSRFPSTSVLLFLHEDFGEERFFQVHDFFQHPPWQPVHIECSSRKLSPHALDHQDFYGLDEHMPIWGLRQVHYGMEILRVTLYCSFDNYEDAVRLYETILQKEASVQKSSFCAFLLYATQSLVVQFCLKQLPLGMSVDPKESSVLQFKVYEIGELVPLLPNPCVPISNTRWQTEDYEGNKILLQVQSTGSKHNGAQSLSPNWHNSTDEKGPPHYHCDLCSSIPSMVPRRTAMQQKNQTLRAMKNRNKSTRRMVQIPASIFSPSQNSISSSSNLYNLAHSSLQDLGPSPMNLGTKLRHSSHELWLCQNKAEEEEETNVDTGKRVVPFKCANSPLNRFSKDLKKELLQSQAPSSSFVRAGLDSEDRNSLLSLGIAEINKRSGLSHVQLRTSGASHGNERDEEEFFI